MPEEAVQPAETASNAPAMEVPEDHDEIHYQAVEKEGVVTAICEIQTGVTPPKESWPSTC